jgi:hypothetical protein
MMGSSRSLKQKTDAIIGFMETVVARIKEDDERTDRLMEDMGRSMKVTEGLVEDKDRAVEAVDGLVKAKERVLQEKIKDELDRTKKMKRLGAEIDFLRGSLRARFLFEKYDKNYMCDLQGELKSIWTAQISRNEKLRACLATLGENEDWPEAIVQLYDNLSVRNRKPHFVKLTNGISAIIVDDDLSNRDLELMRFLAEELYLDLVQVHPRSFVAEILEHEAQQ